MRSLPFFFELRRFPTRLCVIYATLGRWWLFFVAEAQLPYPVPAAFQPSTNLLDLQKLYGGRKQGSGITRCATEHAGGPVVWPLLPLLLLLLLDLRRTTGLVAVNNAIVAVD
jgi:hypothetical protein